MATEITNLGAYLAAGRRAQGAEGVCLHHSASPTAAQYKGAATIDGIRRYHMQTNGWRDIGYHLLLGPDLRLWAGRPLAMSGAHALVSNKAMLKQVGSVNWANQRLIGFCVIGNYEKEPTPNALRLRVIKVVGEALAFYGRTADDLWFHRDLYNTACPGKHWDRADLRAALDAPVIPAWATDGWVWAQAHGIILGNPDAAVNRMSLATVLKRYDDMKGGG